MYDNPYYSSADQLHCANGHSIEPLPYLDPVKTIGRIVNDDYEVIPKLDDYEKLHQFNDVHYDVPDDPLPTAGSNTIYSISLPAGEMLPEDDKTYEDPGHIKEKIYELFKQRNIHKLDKSSIR